MASYTSDMTEGSELGHILRFTLPLLAGNLFQQLYNVVDSVIVGRYLGADALAAVGATGSMTYFFYTLSIGLASGAGILISQAFGAGMHKKVRKFISNSAYVILVFGIITSILSVILAPYMLKMLSTPESIFGDSLGYMTIAVGGTVAVAAYNWINAIMRSLGDSKTPLVFLIVASILNVGLDLLFVLVFKMGINGAAVATITAQAVSAIGSIVFAFIKNPCFKLEKEDYAPDKALITSCITTGMPVALQNATISVSMIFLQRIANSFDKTIIASYTATMRIEQLIQQPFSSLSIALSTFTGQNIGAEKHDRVIKGFHQALKAMVAFSLLMLLVFVLVSENIVSIFVDDPEVISIGGMALKISACFYIFLGLIHTTRGLLNGAGDVGYTMVNGFTEVVGRIGFALILVYLFPQTGHWAVWGTTCLTWTLTGIMSIVRYRGGKWMNKKRV